MRLGWNLVALLSLAAFPAFAQAPSAEQEQRAILTEIAPLAERCAGDQGCFLDHVRPFGPWLVELGPVRGAEDPVFAMTARNFGYGFMLRAAGVAYDGSGNASFFCGEACMRAREAALARSLDDLRPIVKRFAGTGLMVIALWPEGRVRADDRVIGTDGAFTSDRTPVLGVFRGWDLRPDARQPSDAVILRIAASMRAAGIVAIARDESGGIRAIHRDSIAENEQGLLFDPVKMPVIGVTMPNGAEYALLDPIAPGVFIYLRR